MDIQIVAALIGFVGGFIGVFVGVVLQEQHSTRRLRIENTLRLYEMFDDRDVFASRDYAFDILVANFKAPRPKSLSELEAELDNEQWMHISRTRHFFERLCHLLEAGHLDRELAKRFFERLAIRWYEWGFDPLDQLDRKEGAGGDALPTKWDFYLNDVRRLFS